MAQTVIDSSAMKDKASLLKKYADDIKTLYEEMLKNVQTTASKMQGATVEAQKDQFAKMRTKFEEFSQDLKAYGDFLDKAAEEHEAIERSHTSKAADLGRF